MTAAEDKYLSAESEEYVDRIHRKAELHGVRVTVEAQAALNAALAVIHQDMVQQGIDGAFRTVINEVVSEIVDRSREAVLAPRLGVEQ